MKRTGTLLLVLLFLSIMGCARKQKDDFAKELSAKIQVGTTQVDVEKVLDQYGFTHSFDLKTHTIYAIRRGEKSGLVKQDWSAEIKLDVGRKVDSIKVEKVFTGP
jgi:hypothetical protein